MKSIIIAMQLAFNNPIDSAAVSQYYLQSSMCNNSNQVYYAEQMKMYKALSPAYMYYRKKAIECAIQFDKDYRSFKRTMPHKDKVEYDKIMNTPCN